MKITLRDLETKFPHAYHALLSSIVGVVPKGDVVKTRPEDPNAPWELDIRLTVNGVEADFGKIIERFHDHFNEAVHGAAASMVKELAWNGAGKIHDLNVRDGAPGR
jgi:hypothetical protein